MFLLLAHLLETSAFLICLLRLPMDSSSGPPIGCSVKANICLSLLPDDCPAGLEAWGQHDNHVYTGMKTIFSSGAPFWERFSQKDFFMFWCVGWVGCIDYDKAGQQVVEVRSTAITLCMSCVLDFVCVFHAYHTLRKAEELYFSFLVHSNCTSTNGCFQLFFSSHHVNGNLLNHRLCLPSVWLTLCCWCLLLNLEICHDMVLESAIGHHNGAVDHRCLLVPCQPTKVLLELWCVLVPTLVKGLPLWSVSLGFTCTGTTHHFPIMPQRFFLVLFLKDSPDSIQSQSR